jgi:hypothetical protein
MPVMVAVIVTAVVISVTVALRDGMTDQAAADRAGNGSDQTAICVITLPTTPPPTAPTAVPVSLCPQSALATAAEVPSAKTEIAMIFAARVSMRFSSFGFQTLPG